MEYVLPEQADQAVKLQLNIASAFISLASMYKGCQLWHRKVLKDIASKLFSIKVQRAKGPNAVEGKARPTPQATL